MQCDAFPVDEGDGTTTDSASTTFGGASAEVACAVGSGSACSLEMTTSSWDFLIHTIFFSSALFSRDLDALKTLPGFELDNSDVVCARDTLKLVLTASGALLKVG